MSETILLVDDDDSVRGLVGRVLRSRGYEVLEASCARHAEEMFAQRDRAVHLLISDVIMSDLSGPQLGERLRRAEPQLRLLYMSGYPDCAIPAGAVPAAFLEKPFTVSRLVERVRELLDAA